MTDCGGAAVTVEVAVGPAVVVASEEMTAGAAVDVIETTGDSVLMTG